MLAGQDRPEKDGSAGGGDRLTGPPQWRSHSELWCAIAAWLLQMGLSGLVYLWYSGVEGFRLVASILTPW
jgi:hypothetical protein